MDHTYLIYLIVVSHSISKPKESDEVLKEVGDKLKTYPFSFKGAYGWVTVNYLLEKFIKV